MSVDKPSDVLSDQLLDDAAVLYVVNPSGEVWLWVHDGLALERAAELLRRAATAAEEQAATLQE